MVSGLLGSKASNKAADAQTAAANAQAQLQADMFSRVDELQKRLYEGQRADIEDIYDRSKGYAYDEKRSNLWTARQLYNDGTNRARYAAGENIDDLRDGLRRSRNDLAAAEDANQSAALGTRNSTIAGYRDTRDENIADLEGARDQTLGRIDATQRKGVAELEGARDRAIGNFDPYLETGGNALAAARFNLGIGEKPDDYTGLRMSAGTKYQLKAGRNTVEGGAAGAGGLYSGATLESLEKLRNGLVAQDFDDQQNQLIGLAGMGQSAAGSVSGLESGFANDINGIRPQGSADSAAALGSYTGAIAGQRSAANQGVAAARENYYDDTSVNRMWATQQGNALTGSYLPQITGQRDNLTNNLYNIGANYANARTGTISDYYDSLSGLGQNYLANMGTARTNRANLYGTAATNYASGAGAAIGNAGDARAAGAIGSANALTGGLENGLKIYGALGGFQNLTGGSGTPVGTGAPTAFGSLW